MLDNNEELRFAACIDVLKNDIEKDSRNGDTFFEAGLDLKTQLWLAEKLKEINNECNAVTQELYKANKELADLNDRL